MCENPCNNIHVLRDQETTEEDSISCGIKAKRGNINPRRL